MPNEETPAAAPPKVTAADRISTAEQYLADTHGATLALTCATIAIAMLLLEINNKIPERLT